MLVNILNVNIIYSIFVRVSYIRTIIYVVCIASLSISLARDMESIKRGAEIYLNTCMGCHELLDMKYQDLNDIGIQTSQKGKIASQRLMEQNINLTSIIRSRGARYILNILKGYKKDKNSEWVMKDGMYFNYFFDNNYIQMPPFLTDDQMIEDVVCFLEWSADRYADMRFKVGLKVMVYLFIMLIFIGVYLVFHDTEV